VAMGVQRDIAARHAKHVRRAPCSAYCQWFAAEELLLQGRHRLRVHVIQWGAVGSIEHRDNASVEHVEVPIFGCCSQVGVARCHGNYLGAEKMSLLHPRWNGFVHVLGFKRSASSVSPVLLVSAVIG